MWLWQFSEQLYDIYHVTGICGKYLFMFLMLNIRYLYPNNKSILCAIFKNFENLVSLSSVLWFLTFFCH